MFVSLIRVSNTVLNEPQICYKWLMRWVQGFNRLLKVIWLVHRSSTAVLTVAVWVELISCGVGSTSILLNKLYLIPWNLHSYLSSKMYFFLLRVLHKKRNTYYPAQEWSSKKYKCVTDMPGRSHPHRRVSSQL